MDLQFVTRNLVGLDIIQIIVTIAICICVVKYYINEHTRHEFEILNNKSEKIFNELNNKNECKCINTLDILITKVDNNNEDLYQLNLKVHDILFNMIDLKYKNRFTRNDNILLD